MNDVPTVQVDPDARAWLGKHDGALMIRPSPRHGCCGGQALVPVVERGRPRAPEHYHRVAVANVLVYVSRRFPSGSTLHVRMESLLGWKRLFVDGAGLETAAGRATSQGA